VQFINSILVFILFKFDDLIQSRDKRDWIYIGAEKCARFNTSNSGSVFFYMILQNWKKNSILPRTKKETIYFLDVLWVLIKFNASVIRSHSVSLTFILFVVLTDIGCWIAVLSVHVWFFVKGRTYPFSEEYFGSAWG
jgi:hypothetical protein